VRLCGIFFFFCNSTLLILSNIAAFLRISFASTLSFRAFLVLKVALSRSFIAIGLLGLSLFAGTVFATSVFAFRAVLAALPLFLGIIAISSLFCFLVGTILFGFLAG
jgi:hypothetical protein